MNTPTPSAHSGEQGKPSDKSLVQAFYEHADTIGWPDFKTILDRARELERSSSEQGEPVSSSFVIAKPTVNDSAAPERLVVAPTPSDQAGIAHSEGCAISDEAIRIGVIRLRNVVATLREEGNFRDEEGEDTDDLEDLLVALSASQRGVGSSEPEMETLRQIASAWTQVVDALDASAVGWRKGSATATYAELACEAVRRLAHPAPEAQAEGDAAYWRAMYDYALTLIDAAADDEEGGMAGVAFSAQTPIDLIDGKTPAQIADLLCRNAISPQPSASETPSADFESVLRPVVQWLNANGNPHMSIVVTTTGAELLSGQQAFETFDYVRG